MHNMPVITQQEDNVITQVSANANNGTAKLLLVCTYNCADRDGLSRGGTTIAASSVARGMPEWEYCGLVGQPQCTNSKSGRIQSLHHQNTCHHSKQTMFMVTMEAASLSSGMITELNYSLEVSKDPHP